MVQSQKQSPKNPQSGTGLGQSTRGQQEGLQYDRGSSGAVDSRIAQVENIGKMWDRLYEGAISGLAIIFHA